MRRLVLIAFLLAACGEHPATPQPAPRALPHSVRLALGGSWSCVITRAQDVVCWGEIPAEVEGVAEEERIHVPHAIPALHGAIELAASERTLCARMADHRVSCWGEDAQTAPVEGRAPGGVTGLERTRSLAVGAHLVCGIEGEALRCVGRNRSVTGAVSRDAVLLSVAGSVCAVDGVGPARCVGPEDDAAHEVAGSEGAVSIAVADGVCAVSAAGELRCDPDATAPAGAHLEPVAGAAPAAWVAGAANVRCVASRGADGAASGVSCARSGTGMGPRESSLGEPIVALAVGSAEEAWHACAIASEDDVRCWGANRVGEVGVPLPTEPVMRMDEIPEATGIAFSHQGILVIDRQGSVRMRPACCAETGDPIAGIGPVSQLVSLGDVLCARETGGGVVCWEREGAPARFEALGSGPLVAVGGRVVCAADGERVLCADPRSDARLTLTVGEVRALAAYESQLCAVVRGDVACMSVQTRFGSGIPFQWHPIDGFAQRPARGRGAIAVAELFAGTEQMFVTRTDGSAVARGHNGAGQLGIRPSRPIDAPAPTTLPPGTTAMAFAQHVSCAWGPGSALSCAGLDATLTPRNVGGFWWAAERAEHEAELRGDGSWTTIDSVRDVRAVALSDTLGCAVDGAGATHCFGRWPSSAERARVSEPVAVRLRGIGPAPVPGTAGTAGDAPAGSGPTGAGEGPVAAGSEGAEGEEAGEPAEHGEAGEPAEHGEGSADEATGEPIAEPPAPVMRSDLGGLSPDDPPVVPFGWTARGAEPLEIEATMVGTLPRLRGIPLGTPHVRSEPVDVRGALSSVAVRRVVRRHLPEIRFCYEQGVLVRPGVSGGVTVSFIIGATGAVSTATVSATSLRDAEVERCMVTAVRRWTFPAPPGGGVVGVNAPFALELTVDE